MIIIWLCVWVLILLSIARYEKPNGTLIATRSQMALLMQYFEATFNEYAEIQNIFMTIINPYIYFDGNCEEAFNFYQIVFRKEVSYIGRYKDVPKTDRQIFQEPDEKIMHITLPLSTETILMGSDNTFAYKDSIAFRNFSLIIHTDSKTEADRLFNELSENGEIKVPMSLTFWGSYYGICIDKFGISWKITSESKQ